MGMQRGTISGVKTGKSYGNLDSHTSVWLKVSVLFIKVAVSNG